MNRMVKDFLQDDDFIFNVFEGISLNRLIDMFQVNSSEMKQFKEAFNVLNVPTNIACGLSNDEMNQMKRNCRLSLWG